MKTLGRNVAIRAIALIVPIVVSLCATELLLRWWDPLGMWYFSEAARYFALMQPDPRFAYIHRPGMRGTFQGAAVAINSLGFRGPEVDVAHPQPRTRILILGDSVVFGWGVAQDDIFAMRLRRMLERERPDIEVIPAGVGSWNTRNEYEYLKSTGMKLRPRVIVLVIVDNDADPHTEGHTDVPRERLFPKPPDSAGNTATGNIVPRLWRMLWRGAVAHSHIAAHIQYYQRKAATALAKSQITAESPRWEDAKLALDGMLRLSRETGSILIPWIGHSAGNIDATGVLKLYRDYFHSKGMHVFTLSDELGNNPRLRNSVFDSHPNAEGHALLSEQMYDSLRPILSSMKREEPRPRSPFRRRSAQSKPRVRGR